MLFTEGVSKEGGVTSNMCYLQKEYQRKVGVTSNMCYLQKEYQRKVTTSNMCYLQKEHQRKEGLLLTCVIFRRSINGRWGYF